MPRAIEQTNDPAGMRRLGRSSQAGRPTTARPHAGPCIDYATATAPLGAVLVAATAKEAS